MGESVGETEGSGVGVCVGIGVGDEVGLGVANVGEGVTYTLQYKVQKQAHHRYISFSMVLLVLFSMDGACYVW